MTKLLELKEKLIQFYEEYEIYVFPGVKFVIAMILFMIINTNIGYMSKISSFPAALVLALVCCLLPVNGMVVIAGLVVLADMYALSMEAALVTLILILLVFLLYFRFAPKSGIAVVLTPICFKLNIPYVMPIGSGLLGEIYSIVSVICGTVMFYFLDGVHRNSTVLSNVTTEDSSGAASKLSVTVNQLISNKEMFLVIGIFIIASLVVYFIRRMQIDNSWMIAIVAGTLVQVLGLISGYVMLGISGKTISLILGSIVSLGIAFVIKFFCMNLDYNRVERVQFEDDDYYYYVRAVPKKLVAAPEKTVKHFGNTASMGKRIDRNAGKQEVDEEVSRKVFAKELDIDEDLLK